MGVGGGLLKLVFWKRRSSAGGRQSNEKNTVEKGRWSLNKIKFCRDDFQSAPTDDSASAKSSEATITPVLVGVSETTVTLPTPESSGNEGIQQKNIAEENEEQAPHEEEDSINKPTREEDAAISIQSAFRGFQARRQVEQIRQLVESEEIEMFSRASVGTSIEVQGGDSVKNLKVQGENISIQQRMHHKARSQVSKLKEEWDDSTVSSNISKLRIQNRLEAMTRRERALAYAFSQQLRTCSTKKRSTHHESNEPNMGWSWLERWMATRLPENPPPVEESLSKHLVEPVFCDRRSTVFKKNFDLALEEKESCGSNDVSVSLENLAITSQNVRDAYTPVKSRLKSPRSTPRRNNTPSYCQTTRANKVNKRVSLSRAEKEELHKQMQTKHEGETLSADSLQSPTDHHSNISS